jgi:biopolymer transport protein ExbB/TolQ
MKGYCRVLDLIKAGGWLMAPILACSLAAAVIIIERLWALRRARVLPVQAIGDSAITGWNRGVVTCGKWTPCR